MHHNTDSNVLENTVERRALLFCFVELSLRTTLCAFPAALLPIGFALYSDWIVER
jgi:hypothetical protein